VAREWFEIWKTDKAESHYSKVIARLEKDVSLTLVADQFPK